MIKYAVLQNPGHNRVYFNSSGKLAKNELSALFWDNITEIKEELFGGIEYITFFSENKLSEENIILLSRLSFVYAIFEVADSNLFLPVTKNHSYFFGDDLNMILKYSGKTNEIFTRMIINLAVFASGFKNKFLETLNLLDPVCGKGTTVFDGLICGYNSYGIDLSEKLINESSQFLKKYLETGRYKHSLKEEKISGIGCENKAFKSQRHLFDVAKNKVDQKENKNLTCEFIGGDARNINKYYKKNNFHIIVGDLPYGIQHENTTGKDKMRNPVNLIKTSIPVWTEVLKPNGAIVLSWNTFLLKREELENIFVENKLEIINFGDFSHRVDQAINRDVIVGVKR
ncbi:MAG: hypothetical protein FWF92_00935 [Oscillospiraceae bacterium]|nr:hypothetical protein [Oscillospiraceae bacterium]